MVITCPSHGQGPRFDPENEQVLLYTMIFRRCIATFFTKAHHWLQFNKDTSQITIGLTDYALKLLGEAVYIEVLPINSVVELNQPIGVVESVKSATDISAPLNGKISAVNNRIIQKPALLNRDPQREGWICQIETSRPIEELASIYGFLSLHDYQNFCQSDEASK